MSDVVVSVIESTTNVTVTEQDVAVAVTETSVDVSSATAGIQGASYAKGDPIYEYVRNSTGATLLKGQIVYLSGATGNHVNVSLAQASGDSTSARTIGWVSDNIANNAEGYVMMFGYLEGIDTSAANAVGDILYLSPTVAGGWTSTKPYAPDHLVYVGVCVRKNPSNGAVSVHIQNGYELDEIHDVQITSKTNNDVLQYDSATSLWKNESLLNAGIASLGSANAFTTGGHTITAESTAIVPLVLKGASGQSANLLELQNSASTILSRFTSAGSLYINTNNNTTGIEFLGTSGTQIISANGNDLGLRPRFDVLFSPADSSGRLRPSNDNTSDLGTSGQRWKNVYSSGLFVTNSTAGNVVATVKGASGQSASFFEVLANAGNTLFRVNATGYGMTPLGFISGGTTMATNARNTFYTAAAASIGLVIQGAASQTANLQEWQNSAGTVLSRIDQNGSISVPFLGSLVANSSYLQTNADTQSITFFAGAAASKGVVVRGFASQTANLQEWQNSAGTVRAKVDSNGNVFGQVIAGINSLVFMREENSGGLFESKKLTAAASNPGANNGKIYFRDGTTTGTLKLVVRAGAAGAETTILDNIPQ